MALVKGTLSRFVWKIFFYKGLTKKSLLFEALMVWALQKNFEAQDFEDLPSQPRQYAVEEKDVLGFAEEF